MESNSIKRKIGVLTMHRVINFGSILQTYATQVIIEKLGYDCEFINYQYPNKYHINKNIKKDYILKIIRFFLQIKQGFPGRKQKRMFKDFTNKYLHLSEYYKTQEEILQSPPLYDTYVVGSDQTWNVRHMKGDPIFLLSFTPAQRKKISYAASAARMSIDDKYQKDYIKYLSQFSAISVRETNSQILIKNLINKDASVLIDPTLMLNAQEWSKIAKHSKLKIGRPYILIYILKYSFNPYPYVTELIRNIYKQLQQHIVIIRYSERENLGINDVTNLYEGIGPCEFAYLFQNASFVITTSFHGTAFSIINQKSFYSLVNPNIDDDRISSLLKILGCENRGINYKDAPNYGYQPLNYNEININLNKERKKAEDFLKNNL